MTWEEIRNCCPDTCVCMLDNESQCSTTTFWSTCTLDWVPKKIDCTHKLHNERLKRSQPCFHTKYFEICFLLWSAYIENGLAVLVEIILISITPTLLIQDQSGGTQSNAVLSKGNPNLVDVGVSCVKGGQLKEQFPSGNDFSLKVLTCPLYLLQFGNTGTFILIHALFSFNRWENHTQLRSKERDGQEKSIRSLVKLWSYMVVLGGE